MNNKGLSKTKTFLLFCMLIPLIGISQAKNLLSSHRVFPKVDKVLEFEKALANHAQKYHKGDAQWRVYDIQSGPDYGGFFIVEGPTSWEGEDSRGDLGAGHKLDWNKSVAIYLTDRQSGGYSVFLDSLSSVAIGEFSNKVNISHVYPKTGQSDRFVELVKKLKKTWTAAGISVAVYSESSGKPQYTLATRYKQGLKERTIGFRKPLGERFDAVNGENSYVQYLKDVAEYVEDSWSEIIAFRADLSSK